MNDWRLQFLLCMGFFMLATLVAWAYGHPAILPMLSGIAWTAGAMWARHQEPK